MCWSTPPQSFHRLAFEDTTPEQYDSIQNLNLRSVFFCTQGAASALRAARGKVVNLADLSGLEPWPGFVAHSVTKAGVVMLTKVLARSLAPGSHGKRHRSRCGNGSR